MKELMNYFDEIDANVNKEKTSLEGKDIPEVMHKFYETIGSIDLPYGRIYDVDLAIRKSQRAPFAPDWFVFGQDNYSSFWLCYKGDNDYGCYFIYWDHESGLEIEEPIWEDLLLFLKEVEENSDEW